ncbi:acetolactate decarboxylase [Subtercola boreus]|uniref:Alpha-acetolactate decarboxylase n=1 Tax=Subtercola boreus TaxID=120213 RepID=A0A3E0VFZ5_9MICO|nr:acetolactate decarboxylase [Subtercola boreus]RFA08876.1 acetolactate decarboxylase [Subtercola boreus]TQL54148.1 acetolactate decarboxylase [Subtercola boreus]
MSIHQFSVIQALMAGLYDGAFPTREVLAAGDFGLGCGNALNGELVIVDGQVFRCTDDGAVSPGDPDELLPFAEVVPFAPTLHHELAGSVDRTGLEALITGLVGNPNQFYAIRLDGEFSDMLVREPVRQHHPYRPLPEVMTTQREMTLPSTTGTLVGFWAPHIFQGVSVAGYHLHYLNDSRTHGGHTLNYTVTAGTLHVQPVADIEVHLPGTPEFAAADLLSPSADADIRRVESTSASAR